MRNRTASGSVALFLLRFALIFGLLIVPWPGWNEIYGQYFRQLGQTAFSRDEGKRVIVFTRNVGLDDSCLDTRITLANRELLDVHGTGLVKRTGLDTRSIGWVPTALTVALIAATPIPLRRRFVALVVGLVLVQFYILFSLQCWIWNNSPDVFLVTLSSLQKQIVVALDDTLMNQLGASFSIPVLIWIVVTFCRSDVPKMLRPQAAPGA